MRKTPLTAEEKVCCRVKTKFAHLFFLIRVDFAIRSYPCPVRFDPNTCIALIQPERFLSTYTSTHLHTPSPTSHMCAQIEGQGLWCATNSATMACHSLRITCMDSMPITTGKGSPQSGFEAFVSPQSELPAMALRTRKLSGGFSKTHRTQRL